MPRFLFSLEYEGKHQYGETDLVGSEYIEALSILSAINQFASKKKLNLESFDLLDDNSYRVFFHKKQMFKHPIEIVYRAFFMDNRRIM